MWEVTAQYASQNCASRMLSGPTSAQVLPKNYAIDTCNIIAHKYVYLIFFNFNSSYTHERIQAKESFMKVRFLGYDRKKWAGNVNGTASR